MSKKISIDKEKIELNEREESIYNVGYNRGYIEGYLSTIISAIIVIILISMFLK